MTDLLLICIIMVAIYKMVDLSLQRYERLKAMQKLESKELVEYLGKAVPKGDTTQNVLWWLARLSSVLIGFGISLCLSFLIDYLPEGKYANTKEMVLLGCMILLSTIGLLIELVIERKARK